MAAPCPACGRAKSEVAVCCPHCGSADAARDPRDADLRASKQSAERVRLSPAESAVLLQTSARQPAFWTDFLLPSPNLSGLAMLFDMLLIVLSLPLVAGIAVSLVAGRSRDGKAMITGHYVENLLVALLGGVVFVLLGYQLDMVEQALLTAGMAALALTGRVFLRARGGFEAK